MLIVAPSETQRLRIRVGVLIGIDSGLVGGPLICKAAGLVIVSIVLIHMMLQSTRHAVLKLHAS